MARIKISRKKLLQEPDEFLSLSQKVWLWVHDNQSRALGIAGGVAAVVLLIVVGMLLVQRSRANRADELARTVERYLAAKEGVSPPDVSRDLEDLATKHAGAVEGRLADYFLGGYLGLRGEYARAAAAFTKVEQSATGSDLGVLARVGAGYLDLARGEADRALEGFQKLLQEKGSVVPRAQLQIEVGMLLEKKGRAAEARRVYQDVAQAYPQSSFGTKAEERLRLLKEEAKASL